jgi:hypothetical protein
VTASAARSSTTASTRCCQSTVADAVVEIPKATAVTTTAAVIANASLLFTDVPPNS